MSDKRREEKKLRANSETSVANFSFRGLIRARVDYGNEKKSHQMTGCFSRGSEYFLFRMQLEITAITPWIIYRLLLRSIVKKEKNRKKFLSYRR